MFFQKLEKLTTLPLVVRLVKTISSIFHVLRVYKIAVRTRNLYPISTFKGTSERIVDLQIYNILLLESPHRNLGIEIWPRVTWKAQPVHRFNSKKSVKISLAYTFQILRSSNRISYRSIKGVPHNSRLYTEHVIQSNGCWYAFYIFFCAHKSIFRGIERICYNAFIFTAFFSKVQEGSEGSVDSDDFVNGMLEIDRVDEDKTLIFS